LQKDSQIINESYDKKHTSHLAV